ncbi:MAG: amidohydrolase family protein [Clostridia bacterium]|nr:amidohydrolase family protein [Clostridia bacterium]
MIRFEGNIITCDSQNTVAAHLVAEGGRVAYVGDDLPSRYRDAALVSLGQRALLPSFVDTHQHFASFAAFHAGLNLMEAETDTNAGTVEALRSFAGETKDGLVIAFGASPHSVQEGRLLNREELDSACPGRPAVVVKYDGHACVINTKLLEIMRDKLSGLRGYHPDTGEMNQEAFFKVCDHMTRSISTPGLVRNMQRAMDFNASRGIGMVHTVSGVGFPGNLDISLEKWTGRSAQSGFQLRVFPQSMDIRTATSRGLPRIGGCFATALDGCFGSRDAALHRPYERTADQGVLYYSDERVEAFCKAANRAGLQIELHAIGDAAFDQAAKALRAALDDFPRDDHRHGIIHACLTTEEGLSICRDYRILLLVQTAFIAWKQEPDRYLRSILGSRCERLNPVRTMLDAGLTVAAGSDAPTTTPDPIAWIHKACNHDNPEQSLSVYQALRLCTYNGAFATFDEGDRGSLETGKIADMALLSQSPYDVPAEKLNTLKTDALYLRGKPYANQSRPAVASILRGMLSRGKI